MASYFENIAYHSPTLPFSQFLSPSDDLNIKVKKKPASGSTATTYNIDVSQFMAPSDSLAQGAAQGSFDSIGADQFLRVANLFGGFREQASGDYVQQEFLDNLISQLLEESNASAKGPPPASKRFILTLPSVPKSAVGLDDSCTICKDVFHTSGSQITKMPCGHFFDRDCLLPWLELHNTCPMCRAEVETEQKAKEEEEEEERDWMYG
ncbi:hypothetical protein BC937DRAFT_89232 [Endogone sp. FLAS-F59071]|nr:hypothetical protein BC937DRAFT_89232 [Endogone sp. FLAS-F59071]|eukprot:RUS18010.1 hypothetical protein BC937DRAFT_89232 [Endogone sp. FLAS-F59071]